MGCRGAILVWRFSEEGSCLIRTRAVRLVAACLLSAWAGGTAFAQGTAAQPVPPRQAPAARPAAPGPARPGPARPAASGTARPAATTGPVRSGGSIQTIKVEGNQRIETSTILSYMLVQPGDPFDADRLDRSLKTLYATGLFQDVRLDRARRHAGRARGGESAGQPRGVRRQPQAKRRPAAAGIAAQAACRVHAGLGRGGSPADPRSVRQAGLLRRAGRSADHPPRPEPGRCRVPDQRRRRRR